VGGEGSICGRGGSNRGLCGELHVCYCSTGIVSVMMASKTIQMWRVVWG
jgi:hypothetical protein